MKVGLGDDIEATERPAMSRKRKPVPFSFAGQESAQKKFTTTPQTGRNSYSLCDCIGLIRLELVFSDHLADVQMRMPRLCRWIRLFQT